MDEPPSDAAIPLAKPVPLEHKPFYSIEYPGYVQLTSVPKAMDRLGGAQIVAETFRRGLKVDLKLKDNDPFAHPPNGQAVTTHNLLLKVVRRTRKKRTPSAIEEGGEDDDLSNKSASKGQFTAEVAGVVQKTLRFRNPIDFQYQPPKDDPVVELRNAMMRLDAGYILSYRLPEEKEDYSLSLEEQESRGLASSSNVRAIPPPIFTRYDLPINYNFKQNPSSVPQTVVNKETGETSTRLVNTTRLQEGYPLSIKWNDPTPTSPGPEREALRPLVRDDLLQKLEEQFAKRPIWTRLGLLNQLKAEDVRRIHNAKQVWALCSYAFQEGPWRDSVVRLGYDPRQDPEAIKYQIVSIRNLKNPALRHSMLQSQGTSSGTQRDVHSHTFDGKTVRHAGTFQFCDITDPVVRRFLDNPSNRSETCSDRDGWLNHITAERIKSLMKFKHQQLADTGVGPTEEECASLLVPDDQYAVHLSRKLPAGGYKKKRSKAKRALPEEEVAARRLELAVHRMEEDAEMDVDE
ncbi:hypothetical protein CPB86DRAFT_783178 [Serendipita vermifera]|nr:hypothetical protein CPB86DRAFT_783178 [Serendipita vermifera]